jgi:hypothetical protein
MRYIHSRANYAGYNLPKEHRKGYERSSANMR